MNSGRGALVPRRVVWIYRNVIREWVRLTWEENGAVRAPEICNHEVRKAA